VPSPIAPHHHSTSDGHHHLRVRLRALGAAQVGVLVGLGLLLGTIAVWSGFQVRAAVDRQERTERQYRELSDASARMGDIRATMVEARLAGTTPPRAAVREFRMLAGRVIRVAEGGEGAGVAGPGSPRAATALYLRAALTMSRDTGWLHPGAMRAGRAMAPAARTAFTGWQRDNARALDDARADVRATVRTAGLALPAALVLLLAAGLWVWRMIERSRVTGLAALRASERRQAALVRHCADLVLAVGDDDAVQYASPSCAALADTGEPPPGTALADLVHPEDRAEAADLLRRCRRSDDTQRATVRLPDGAGGWRDVELIAADMRGDAAVGALVLSGRDVTERIRMQEALSARAFRDPLTGLANRALFESRLEHALPGTRRFGRPLAVLLLDLDDFKTYNDSLGHAAGDRILAAVARRLEGAVRGVDTAARLGGDEFAVLLEHLTADPDLPAVLARIIQAVEEPMLVEGAEVSISAGIGVAISAQGDETPDELLRSADLAMYAAKADGPGRWRVFRPGMRERAAGRLALRADLQRAVDRGELVLSTSRWCACTTGASWGPRRSSAGTTRAGGG
jgi:diguanylate cyclase (GGDEF)-like protein/PAS domain S-box-containing protein